jgi:hypothetical protein
VIGLFSSHVGQRRNLPIVRSGNLASMPVEPLIDADTGYEFNAYLAEVRSIGGLSGSPVFVVLNPDTRLIDDQAAEGTLVVYLLGMVRGHWDRRFELDFHETEFERLNTGIAMVTPITDVLALLEREEFVSYRKDMDRQFDMHEAEGQVKDWAPPGTDPGESASEEFSRFEALTRGVVRVPKKEVDEKRTAEES